MIERSSLEDSAMKSTVMFASVVFLGAMGALQAQQISKPTLAGVTNLSRLETTVACAGATGPEAMPEIKKMGFASVINLRQASEPDANIPAAEAAAKAVGLKYIHVPFNAAAAGSGRRRSLSRRDTAARE